MAKLTATLHGNFQNIVRDLTETVLNGSISASEEDSVQYTRNGVQCYTGVFERYSYTGGNRVSMSITLFGDDVCSNLCVITAGGSTGTFFKLNTFGEEAFLETIEACVRKYEIQ